MHVLFTIQQTGRSAIVLLAVQADLTHMMMLVLVLVRVWAQVVVVVAIGRWL